MLAACDKTEVETPMVAFHVEQVDDEYGLAYGWCDIPDGPASVHKKHLELSYEALHRDGAGFKIDRQLAVQTEPYEECYSLR